MFTTQTRFFLVPLPQPCSPDAKERKRRRAGRVRHTGRMLMHASLSAGKENGKLPLSHSAWRISCPLGLFHIAMENGPAIDDLPFET